MRNKLFTYIIALTIFSSILGLAFPTKVLAATGTDVVTEAKKHLGKPYIYGTAGPSSFDCSGLVQYVYKQLNINLPRTTFDQINSGTAVSQDKLQPGDLVFTASYHVGVYVGNNQIIHAPQDNDVVKTSTIWSFYAARRILSSSDSNTPNTDNNNKNNNTNIPYINESLEKLVFNAQFYANKYPDLKKAFGYDSTKLLNHWRTYGINEGRASSEVLDLGYYLKNNPDLIKVYGSSDYKKAYNHFITWGYKQNRKSSPVFDMAYYKNTYSSVKALPNNIQVIQNFLTTGMNAGRKASVNFDPKIYALRYPSLKTAFGTNYKLYYDHYLFVGFKNNLRGV